MGKKRGDRKKSEYIEWIIVAAVLLTYFLVVLLSYYSTVKKDAVQRVNKEIIAHGDNLSTAYLEKISLLKQTTVTVANMIGEKGVDIKSPAIRSKLGRSISYSPAHTGMVIAIDGTAVRDTGENEDLTGNKYFNACMSGECVISDIEYDEYSRDYVVSAYAPIYNKNKILGAVCLCMRTSRLTEPEKEEELDGRTIYAILNSEGIMTATYGSSAPESGTNIYDYLGGRNSEYSKKLAQNLENNKSGILPITVNDEDRILNYRDMGQNSWYTIEMYSNKYIERKQQSYYSAAKDVIFKLIVALIIFFLIVVLINLFSQMLYSSKSKELQSKAETDLLTGMLNKIATEKHIQDYIDNEGKKIPGMLILVDIDNFKKINDTMGHAFGDQVLSTLGHTISNEFRISDIFGRIGGDEFIIYLKNIPNDEIRDKEARKLITFFNNFQAGDYVKYSVGASIGVSMYPKDGSSFEELYKAADKAVYRSKQEGKNQLRFYSDEDKIVKA